MKISRRKFVSASVILIAGVRISGISAAKTSINPIRFGIVSDIHYADRPLPENSTRYYSQSVDKLAECVDLMNEQNVDFLIELGDFKDEGAKPREQETLSFLTTIEKEFSRFNGPRYHVLGNHDHDSISKQQFLANISNTGFNKALNYYSFDKGSFHFIVLDANYTSDGVEYDHGKFSWTDAYVPQRQQEWLKKDLQSSKLPSIVFIHHRLDAPPADRIYCPGNADAIRKILEDDGNVILVLQGHHHSGDLSKVNNIHYYTLKAVVEGHGPENNNYAIVEIGSDLSIRIIGYRKTASVMLG